MKKKILIIDDEEAMVSYLSSQLSKENYETFVAHDGQEGLSVMSRQHVDAVIMDDIMPEMDGYTLCQKMKASEDFSDVPIVICTAHADGEKEFRKLGIDDYIVKPFTFDSLFASLNRIFKKISRDIKFKKVLIQTNKTADIDSAMKQIEEYGFRIDVLVASEDKNIIEESIRDQPDIVMFNALGENRIPEEIITSLKSYVEFRGLKIILYVDHRHIDYDGEMNEIYLQELKSRCIQAGADGWVDYLDRESFLNVLFEYCKG